MLLSIDVSLLRKTIRAILEAKAKPEAPVDAPFGQYFLGSWRMDSGEEEEDTPIEYKIGSELRRHFYGGDKIPAKSVRLLFSMLEKGWYKDWLKPKHSKYVYRGLDLKSAQLGKLLGHPPKRNGGVERVNITVPRKTNRHWTTKKEQGSRFAASLSGDSRGFNVLLFALANENEFVLNPKTADALSSYGEEEEVIPSSDIHVVGIAYYPGHIGWDWNKIKRSRLPKKK